MLDRILWVDPERLLPLLPGIFGALEMAVAGGQQHAADVALGLTGEAALQQLSRLFVAFERENDPAP
jgi:hypothetical protein